VTFVPELKEACVDDVSSAGVTSRFFRYGVLLVWIPVLAVSLPGLVSLLGSISPNKTTGLGAVPGGLSEAFITFGFLVFIAAQVVAIVLLIRSFSRFDVQHKLFSVLTVGVSLMCCDDAGWFHVRVLRVASTLKGSKAGKRS
jgi:hypothetical protein